MIVKMAVFTRPMEFAWLSPQDLPIGGEDVIMGRTEIGVRFYSSDASASSKTPRIGNNYAYKGISQRYLDDRPGSTPGPEVLNPAPTLFGKFRTSIVKSRKCIAD